MKNTITITLISFFFMSIFCSMLYVLPGNANKQENVLESSAESKLPMTGFCSKGFEAFDTAVSKFLLKRGFDCATLAIIKDGKFLVKRGYGWSDKNKIKLTNPDDFLRLSSLTKIFTNIGIKDLIKKNKISYETFAINFLENQDEILDQNINKITIFHLLFHQGGWNIDQSLDPFFSLGLITSKLNKEISDLNPHDILQYAIENIKLDFMPGTNSNYSNLGYSILGRIIEKISNTSYLNFINDIICKPLNVKVEIGPSKLSGKSPSEIEFYKSNDIDLNSDSISLKAADSTFGLITSAPNLCKILNTYWIDGDRRNPDEQRQLSKSGTMPGSMGLARQRYSGASIVVLINSRDNNNPELDNNVLKQLIDNTANKCGI